MNSVDEMLWMIKSNLIQEMFLQPKEEIVDDLQLINRDKETYFTQEL